MCIIFVPVVDYYGANARGAKKSCVLLSNIIDCLHQCMLHDTDELFQKDIFKMIMQPLVNQVCIIKNKNIEII